MSANSLLRASARHAAAFTAGAVTGVAAWEALGRSSEDASGVGAATPSKAFDAIDLKRFEQKLLKLQRSSQERVHWPAVDKEMLVLAPRLWMEVLDNKHRYATLLYDYWRRWQLSDTRAYFFEWIDEGQGSLIDLPHAPRRLLDEWRVIYLRRDQQPIFRVRIEPETGRFLWETDGMPVTLPAPACFSEEARGRPATPREIAEAAIFKPALERSWMRDRLLFSVREKVESAMQRREEPRPEELAALAAPLIKEGLLCQLRDPFFSERLDAASTPEGHAHLRAMPRLPETLLPGLKWEDFLKAIDHDMGKFMKNPPARGTDGKGIFVLDSFGPLYCGTKLRGVFHHSSFVRGHCVKVAGGIKIVDGWLVELTPHSGHYLTGVENVDEMINDWKAKGVDFSKVHIRPITK